MCWDRGVGWRTSRKKYATSPCPEQLRVAGEVDNLPVMPTIHVLSGQHVANENLNRQHSPVRRLESICPPPRRKRGLIVLHTASSGSSDAVSSQIPIHSGDFSGPGIAICWHLVCTTPASSGEPPLPVPSGPKSAPVQIELDGLSLVRPLNAERGRC